MKQVRYGSLERGDRFRIPSETEVYLHSARIVSFPGIYEKVDSDTARFVEGSGIRSPFDNPCIGPALMVKPVIPMRERFRRKLRLVLEK